MYGQGELVSEWSTCGGGGGGGEKKKKKKQNTHAHKLTHNGHTAAHVVHYLKVIGPSKVRVDEHDVERRWSIFKAIALFATALSISPRSAYPVI